MVFAPSSLIPFLARLVCPPACAPAGVPVMGLSARRGDAPPPREHSMTSHNKQPPKAVGLYDPRFEHDACGVGMVARLDNRPTHEVISRAITALENLEHRGATGADPRTGDGAGILIQIPDELFRGIVGDQLPPAGRYGVGVCFLPKDDPARAAELEQLLEDTVVAEGQRVVTWRDIPLDLAH